MPQDLAKLIQRHIAAAAKEQQERLAAREQAREALERAQTCGKPEAVDAAMKKLADAELALVKRDPDTPDDHVVIAGLLAALREAK